MGEAYRVFQLRSCLRWLPLWLRGGMEQGKTLRARRLQTSPYLPAPGFHQPHPQRPHVLCLWVLTHHSLPSLHTSSREPSCVAPGFRALLSLKVPPPAPIKPQMVLLSAAMLPQAPPPHAHARSKRFSTISVQAWIHRGLLVNNAGSWAQTPDVLIPQNWGAGVPVLLVPGARGLENKDQVFSCTGIKAQGAALPNLLNGAQWPPGPGLGRHLCQASRDREKLPPHPCC